MEVLIRGKVTDVRKQGENTYSYIYSNSSEPTLYRVKGDVSSELGKEVSVLCSLSSFKDKIYFTLKEK